MNNMPSPIRETTKAFLVLNIIGAIWYFGLSLSGAWQSPVILVLSIILAMSIMIDPKKP